MIKRRIDEDFKHVWAINWNGLPEDFSDATEIVLTASVFGKKTILERGIDYVIEGNLIIVDFTPRFATIAGIYNLELKYIKPNDGFIDGERRSAVDIDVVQIVAKSSQVTATGDITSTSEAMTGFQGLSAYEVWLKDNPDKTKEDYYNWLQKPATEIAETVGLQEQARVEAENTRKNNEEQRVEAETNRQNNFNSFIEVSESAVNTFIGTAQGDINEAISNAESATENANTAAQNADDARDNIMPSVLNNEEVQADVYAQLNARITALEAILSNKIKDRIDVTKEFNVWGKTNLILYGSGASTKTPDFIGQTYIDTTNGNVYIAVGVSNAGNWKLV